MLFKIMYDIMCKFISYYKIEIILFIYIVKLINIIQVAVDEAGSLVGSLDKHLVDDLHRDQLTQNIKFQYIFLQICIQLYIFIFIFIIYADIDRDQADIYTQPQVQVQMDNLDKLVVVVAVDFVEVDKHNPQHQSDY